MPVRLSELATTDGLTALANRRHFDRYLEDEWRRGMRAQTPLALILLDIDDFKRFNDRFGHQAGDACLRVVAAELRRYARRSEDLVGRYGGEEFVVGLPGIRAAEACRHAERIRAAIAGLSLSEPLLTPGSLTVSVGVGQRLLQRSPDELFAEVDGALYRAKQRGRNGVCAVD